MKRKTLPIILTLLVATMVATSMIGPAQARKFKTNTIYEKIDGVTWTGVGTPERIMKSVRNFGNIRISKGVTTSDLVLNIPDMDPLEGTWYSKPVATTEFTAPATDPPAIDPDATVTIIGKVVWTFSGEGTTGTFTGYLIQNYIGYPPVLGVFSSYMYTSMVLWGTRDFKGQTLVLSYEGYDNAGYLLIPKIPK
jgi:hypothetical protein